jgi:WD40 repeat protein
VSDDTETSARPPLAESDPARQFWQLWQQGPSPDLTRFLDSVQNLPPIRLAAVLCVDLRERWRRRERVPAEHYLLAFPKVHADREAALDVVYCEYLVRDALGEAPGAAEFAARFPNLEPELGQQIGVHHALEMGARGGSSLDRTVVTGQTIAARPTSWPGLPGYESLGPLGQGGMGVVHKARQIRLNRIVAVKMLRPGAGESSEALARFRIEGEAVARLQHPNIVQIYEVGEHDAQPYFVMEFADGGSLAQKLNGTPWPGSDAALLVETLARAAHYAHQRGVVHRDLTPGNVLLLTDGTPKLSDFGLAKLLTSSDALTQTGAVAGTPSYMSPEQASGATGKAGPAIDIYALGAILYELVTGRPPFKAATPLETLVQVVHAEPVAPRQLQPRVPRDLETICLKCLRKEPHRRYASAAELADDLYRFRAGQPISARPLGPLERTWRWGRRNPALATVSGLTLSLLLLTAAGSIGFAVYQYQVSARLDAARKEADLLVIQSGMDRAASLCEQGDIDQGMLWWADSLTRAERAGATDAERVIRTNLASWRQRLHALTTCLEHTEPVTDVAFAPSGRIAATASADGTAQLWEVPSGEKIGQPLRHAGPVSMVRFSPDGGMLLTVSGRSAFLWDATTGKRLDRPPLELNADITAVAFAPPGTRFLLAGADGSGRLFDPASGRSLGEPLHHDGRINAAAFSPDGKLVLTGSADGTARLWHADTGKPTTTPPLRHADRVRAVAFRFDGEAVMTGSADKIAQVWQVATGAKIGPSLEHNTTVTAVSFSPDGKTLATASEGWNAYLWEAGTGALRARLRHHGPVRGLQLSADGQTLLTGCLDGKARLWDVVSGKQIGASLSHPGELRTVALSADGQWILTAGHESAVRLWKRAVPPESSVLLDHPGWPFAMAFSSDGHLLAMPCEEHGVQLWDVDTHQPLYHLDHSGLVRAVAFSPNREFIVTGGDDRQARLWRVADGRAFGSPMGHEDELSAAAFSADGQTFLTATMTGTITRWETTTGKQLGQFAVFKAPIWSLAVSPDGRWFVAGSADHTARLGAVATGDLLATLRHQGQVWAVAFSPDGATVLTGSEDQTARLWEVTSGRPLGAPFRAGDRVRTLTFRRDGRIVVVGGWEGGARLWDLSSRKPLTAPFGDNDPVLAAVISADGSGIHTAKESKTVTHWKVPSPIEGPTERIVLWTQLITGMELEAGGAVRVLEVDVWRERWQRLQKDGGPPLP